MGFLYDGKSKNFLKEWEQNYNFPLIVNIRDPRDMILSFVEYLTGSTKYGIGGYTDYSIYAKILNSIPCMKQKLKLAITDPNFPGKKLLRESLWLLNHPNALVVRFENLVGERGGGSEDNRIREMQKIENHCARTWKGAYDKTYNKNSFSFNKGKIGRWKNEFDDELTNLFKIHFSAEMNLMGYL